MNDVFCGLLGFLPATVRERIELRLREALQGAANNDEDTIRGRLGQAVAADLERAGSTLRPGRSDVSTADSRWPRRGPLRTCARQGAKVTRNNSHRCRYCGVPIGDACGYVFGPACKSLPCIDKAKRDHFNLARSVGK